MNQLDRLTCAQVFQRLEDYVDRELSPREMALMEEHLNLCAWCAREHAFEEGFVRIVKSKLQRLQAPPDLIARVSACLAASENGETHP
jgi:anti-sigma factor (TIGR02949 family)